MQIVVFDLNNEVCGADTIQVQEIVKYQDMTKIPEMPEFIDGVINLRGRVVPIVNLNVRFGLGNTEITNRTKIIITKIDEHFIGFIVNDVSEIVQLSDSDMEVPPDIIHKSGGNYLKSVGKKGDQLIAILDLSKILTSTEFENIQNTKEGSLN